MDLIFKILWFENDASAIESLEPILQEHLEDLGFKLFKKRIEGMPPDLDELIKSDSWDLILMDFNLASGSVKGDQIIQQIREHEFVIDVIFYSEDPEFKKEIMKNYLEGVFLCQGRSNLREKVKKIITLSVKKNLDVCNLRGLIIAEAIDLVKQMDGIILDYFKINKESELLFRERVLEEEFFNDAQKYKLIQRILDRNIQSMNEFIAKKVDTTKNPQIQNTLDKISPVKQLFNKFDEDVITYRNNMAHAKCSADEKNVLICRIKSKITPETFDDKKCKDIRKKFIEHSNNLQTMQAILKEIPV